MIAPGIKALATAIPKKIPDEAVPQMGKWIVASYWGEYLGKEDIEQLVKWNLAKGKNNIAWFKDVKNWPKRSIHDAKKQ